MIFIVAWKVLLNQKNEIYTDVVGDAFSKKRIEPDDVCFEIFGQFTFVFILVIWWFALKFIVRARLI